MYGFLSSITVINFCAFLSVSLLEQNRFIMQIYLVYNTCVHKTSFPVHVYTKPVLFTDDQKPVYSTGCPKKNVPMFQTAITPSKLALGIKVG